MGLVNISRAPLYIELLIYNKRVCLKQNTNAMAISEISTRKLHWGFVDTWCHVGLYLVHILMGSFFDVSLYESDFVTARIL